MHLAACKIGPYRADFVVAGDEAPAAVQTTEALILKSDYARRGLVI